MNLDRRLERIETLLMMLLGQNHTSDLDAELAKDRAEFEAIKRQRREDRKRKRIQG